MHLNREILPPRIQQWKDRGDITKCADHDIFYMDSNSGDETIVCIHGFPTSSFDWVEMWESLDSKYRVFAFDLLGFGFSEKPRPYQYTIAEQTDILVELLGKRGIKKFHLLSHDYGTIVAEELLARCCDGGASTGVSILSATFLNGALFPEMHRPRLAQKLLLSPIGPFVSKLFNKKKFKKAFSEVFGENTKPSESEIREFWSLICYNDGHMIAHLLMNYFRERKVFRDRWVHAIQETSIPVSLINGIDDPVSGRHLVARARAELPKAKFFELQNIGHYPQVEAPRAVLEAFFGFLANLKSQEK